MKSNVSKISNLVVLLIAIFFTTCFAGPTLSQRNSSVALRYSSDSKVFQIKDLRNDQVWTSDPIGEGIEIVEAVQRAGVIRLQLRDKPTDAIFNASISLGKGAEVVFGLTAGENDVWPGNVGDFPPVFTADIKDGSLLITDRNGGTLIEQKDDVYTDKVLRVYGAYTCLSLPFTGIVTPDGKGLMVMFDTPADAAVKIVKKENGIHWPQVQWQPSMHKFNYPRKVSYKLFDKGGYVAMAKDYRQYLINKGQFKTLAQKAKERPKVNWLKGAPSIWGWARFAEFYNEAFNYGITHAVLSGSSEGFVIDQNDMKILTQHQWLGGAYDSYTDILQGPTGRQKDDIEKAAVRPAPNSGPLKAWVTLEGLQYYSRSSALAVNAAKSYTPADLKKYSHTQRFIDVSSAIDLFEDYHPDHTYDRRGDMQNRRYLYQYFNDLGLVTRGEFGSAWVVDKVDMLMGAMTSNTFPSWKAAYLLFPKKGEITEKYRKYGMGYDVKIPLWQLVFHDCVVDTWYWGDTAGFVFNLAPELSTRKDLFNILYGTVPLLWFNENGYGWNRNRDRFLQTYQVTCKLHEEIAFDDMLNHQYLSDDKTLQKTTFSSGANVIVNFGKEPKDYTYDQKTVKIAGEGYLVHGLKDFQQSKLVEGDKTITKISKDNYQVLDVTGGEVQVGPIKFEGKIAAFKVDDNRWNLLLSIWKTYEIDLPQLTGWDKNTDFKVSFMDGLGNPLRKVPGAIKDGIFKYRPDPGLNLIMVTK